MTARPDPGPSRAAEGGAAPALWVWASALAVVLAAGSWLWNRDIAPIWDVVQQATFYAPGAPARMWVGTKFKF